MPAMPLPPATHSTCLATSGWNVAWPSGPKTLSRAPSMAPPNSHSLTARHGEEHELAGGEVEQTVERDVERGDVVRQPAQPAHDAAEDARRGRVGLPRLQRAHLQRAVVVGHALAREQVALALEIFPAGGLGPLALRASAREPRLARPARAGGALVGELDPASQPGVENLLSGLARTVARAIPRGDDDLHGRRYPIASR